MLTPSLNSSDEDGIMLAKPNPPDLRNLDLHQCVFHSNARSYELHSVMCSDLLYILLRFEFQYSHLRHDTDTRLSMFSQHHNGIYGGGRSSTMYNFRG